MSEPTGQEGLQHAQARWRLERAGDGKSYMLLVWAAPGSLEPARFPMLAEELYRLVHQADRIISWSSASADGTFTPPAGHLAITPSEARQWLEICGYTVVSSDIEAHTRLVAATPWASWVEEVPPPRAGTVAWFVNVFAGDDGQFAQAADAYGAECQPASYAGGPGAGG